MSNSTTTEVAVKTISTQEVRQLLDSKRSFEFWNVLTDEVQGRVHFRLAPGSTGQGRKRSAKHEFARECGDRRILRRPEVPAEQYGGGEADKAWLRQRPCIRRWP
jgi:hypothetical protein